jgi:UDP-glucose 4-epimerase
MNIAIFGAAGFIGTNLAIQLSSVPKTNLTLVDGEMGYFDTIKSLNLPNTKYVEAKFLEGTDFDQILKNQDLVFHLVSTTVPSTSNLHIYDELRANVNVTALFLNACVRSKIKRLVFISSGGTVYGKIDKCPLQEDMPTDPISSYGLQKITIEKLIYLYSNMHGLDYRIVRLSNPYGPYQRPNGVLGAASTFVYKALKGEDITVYGDGSVVRDFIYIDDTIKALIKVAKDKNDGSDCFKTFNLGSGKGTSIKELLSLVSDALDVKLKINYTPSRPVDVPENYLDISRYESVFGTLEHRSLIEGLKATAVFMKKQYGL